MSEEEPEIDEDSLRTEATLNANGWETLAEFIETDEDYAWSVSATKGYTKFETINPDRFEAFEFLLRHVEVEEGPLTE